MDRAVQGSAVSPSLSPALRKVRNVENLLLFVDDDIRETVLAMTRIEAYLAHTVDTLESGSLHRDAVRRLASDETVLEHLDLLNETVESLRRRLSTLCANMS